MRFLVVSDVHGSNKVISWIGRRAEEHAVDGIIVLGDITHFGPPDWAETFFKGMNRKTYAIPGNCDPAKVVSYIERWAVSLHKTKVKVGQFTFVGMGASNPTIFDTPYEISEREIRDSLMPLMEKRAILVTHAPPFGYNDVPLSGGHTGSESLRMIVDWFHPAVVLSGHIHEARGMIRDGDTLFINPGPSKEGYAALLILDDRISGHLLYMDINR